MVNELPLMTRHLVQQERIFASHPLVLLDVGARGGMNAEWNNFEDQIRVYCFEPDEEECQRLSATAPDNIHYLPYALGAASGPATLYETRLPASSGLYKTQMTYFGRLINADNGVTVGERTLMVRTIDEVVAERGISEIDFIKVDAEGAELDILRSSSDTLQATGVLGILSEIRYQPEINGSPTFADLDTFLRAQGLRLYNLSANRQSRTALPYPGLQDYVLPSGQRFFAYTTHGQVQDGDALYFVDPFLRNVSAKRFTPIKLLKLCALLELYSLNDCAAEIIVANRGTLSSITNPDILLDLLASSISRRSIKHGEYINNYFSSEPARFTASYDAASPAKSSRLITWAGLLRRIVRR